MRLSHSGRRPKGKSKRVQLDEDGAAEKKAASAAQAAAAAAAAQTEAELSKLRAENERLKTELAASQQVRSIGPTCPRTGP